MSQSRPPMSSTSYAPSPISSPSRVLNYGSQMQSPSTTSPFNQSSSSLFNSSPLVSSPLAAYQRRQSHVARKFRLFLLIFSADQISQILWMEASSAGWKLTSRKTNDIDSKLRPCCCFFAFYRRLPIFAPQSRFPLPSSIPVLIARTESLRHVMYFFRGKAHKLSWVDYRTYHMS